MTVSHSSMCMCVPFVSLYDSLLVIIFMLFKNIVILHSFWKHSWEVNFSWC